MLNPGQTRFILAAAVIFYHINQNVFLGEFAVGCFFVLSGYWIALMYESKYAKKSSPLKVFYVSRLWRLLPAFIAFEIVAFFVNLLTRPDFVSGVVSLNMISKIHWFISNIFIVGYASSQYQFIVPAWSLDVELQFYILFPLLYFLLNKNRKLIIWGVIFAFITAMYIWRWGRYVQEYLYLFEYLFLFLFGVMVHRLNIKSNKKIEKWALCVMVLIIFIQYAFSGLSIYYRNGNSMYYHVLSLILIVVAIPSLINSVEKKTGENDKFWGEMSHMIYLSHWVWLDLYHKLVLTDPLHILAHSTKLSRLPYGLIFLAVTFFSSYLIYKLVDRRSEKLRHRWVAQQV